MKATLIRKEQEAPNIHTFFFKTEKEFNYIAGQFTEIQLPLSNPDERGNKRWFTLSSSPTEEFVSITTRLDPVKPSAFKQALFNLESGAQITLAEPMGDFVLPKQKDTLLIFIAGGIGITPMRSMIKWLSDTNEHRDITLYYAAKVMEDMVFLDLFQNTDIKFEPILGSPPSDWQGMTGRLTSKTIMSLPNVLDNTLVYISGPEPMVETFNTELQQGGIPEHRLVMDYFPGYTEQNI